MKHSNRQLQYRVLILRAWQEGTSSPEEKVAWRFSVEDPNTHQRRGFSNLEMLMAFIESETVRNHLIGQESVDRLSSETDEGLT